MDTEKFRKYLLGDLSTEESEELEQVVIFDEEMSESLLEAEIVLVEDHLDGTLSADEELQFTTNYLVTPERRKNEEFVTLLAEYSGARSAARPVTEDRVKKGTSFIHQVRLAFFARPARLYAVSLLILIFAMATYFWFRHDGELGKLQAEYAALNGQDFTDLGQFKDIDTVNVLPGKVRGSDSTVRIGENTSSDNIFVRLALPIEFRSHDYYDVQLIKEKKTIFKFESLRAYPNDGGKELRIILPLKLLVKGAYRIDASLPDKTDSTVTYPFTVQ